MNEPKQTISINPNQLLVAIIQHMHSRVDFKKEDGTTEELMVIPVKRDEHGDVVSCLVPLKLVLDTMKKPVQFAWNVVSEAEIRTPENSFVRIDLTPYEPSPIVIPGNNQALKNAIVANLKKN